MATDYSQLYDDSTMTLAKTMTIKSATSANLVNDYLKLEYPNIDIDKTDPTTWKYYLNISGKYHITDTVMRVISLDTLEEIDFTADNLAIHSATREAYAYGSRYYYALLDKYPKQEQIILGILYPSDINTAVSVDDYTILAYPTGLVEAQEITLIKELQDWMYRYAVRWDVQAFGISDSLYPVAQHAVFYLQLVPKLYNLRLKRCKTPEAHSFHIRSYLASHSNLDQYYDYMTTEQALFLYRNINYIERNVGKTNIFNWLVEKILTLRNIPIARYEARLEGKFDENYYPEYRFRRIPLNTEFNTTNQDYYSLDQILAKEKHQAIGNSDYIAYDRDKIDLAFKNSPSSALLTKNLESSLTDYTGNQVNPLSEILFNHWGWLAVNNKYRVAINFKDPVTSELRTLFTDDAFVYYVYIFMMGMGARINTIPKFFLKRVQKFTLPTVAELYALTDKKHFDTDIIPKWIINNQPNLKACLSVNNFFKLGNEIFNAEQAQWYLISRTENHFERAIVSNLCNQLFEDVEVSFDDTGSLYYEWLKNRSLPTDSYTPAQCIELLSNIFEAATGYSVDPTNMIGNIQKAMLSIMGDLSSYSIKFIQEINENPVKPINWAAIRVGDTFGSVKTEVLTDDRNEIIDSSIELIHVEKFTITPDSFIEFSHTHLKPIIYDFDSVLDINVQHTTADVLPVLLGRLDVLYLDTKEQFQNYDNLTNEQKSLLRDIYDTQVVTGIASAITQRPISDVILNTQLSSLQYLGLTDTEIDPSSN